MPSHTVNRRDLLRDISNAEWYLQAARKIVESDGDIADLHRVLEQAQHAAFDAKGQVIIAFR